MKENACLEEKISRTLQAIKHPENFTDEELHELLNDEVCLQTCRDILDSKEALARRNAPAPDVEKEWAGFSSLHKMQMPIRAHKVAPRVRRTQLIGFGIALVAASIALLFRLYTPEHSSYTVFKADAVVQEISISTHGGTNLLTVPRGMNKQITLADGTRVWLNAESRLEYPATFEGHRRRVVHLEGEAYFKVAKDAAHPFIVETGLLETQVLGTSFNVRVYSPEDAQVTLSEGSVKVSDARHKKTLLLTPGQNATLQKGGGFSLHEVQAGDYNSWTEGQFYFDNTELVEIMRELGRWYNINIIFTGKEAMHYRMHFQADRKDSLPHILELLNSMRKVNARLENNKVIVSL